MKRMATPAATLIALLLLCTLPIPKSSAISSSQDTDGDGIPDTHEDSNGNGAVDSGETDPFNADTDRGGESDGSEVMNKRNPFDPTDDMTADTDGDGWVNGIELLHGTDPALPDSDGDGVNDPQDGFPTDRRYANDTNRNGLPDEWERATNLANQPAPQSKTDDPDGDGLTNIEEFVRQTNPTLTDSDRDGIDDKTEIETGTSPSENSCLSLGAAEPDFPDMNGHWSASYVALLRRIIILPQNTPVIRGYSVTTVNGEQQIFAPSQPITRFEFLKMVLFSSCTHLRNDTDRLGVTFSDVRTTPVIGESADAIERRQVIATAAHLKIVDGYADGTFRPDAPVNRAEAVKILLKATQLEEEGTGSGQSLVFSDVQDSDWFAPFVRAVTSRQIVQGYTDGTFGPKQPITRAETAKIVLLAIRQNPAINGYVVPEIEKL